MRPSPFRSILPASLTFLSFFAGCGGGSGTPVCMDSATPQTASAYCAPGRIAAGKELRLQIREQCGGCLQQAARCEAVVSGMNVTLRLLGKTCTLPPDTNCPAICAIGTFDCVVPALASGTYMVSVEGSPAAGTLAMMADPSVSTTTCMLSSP